MQIAFGPMFLIGLISMTSLTLNADTFVSQRPPVEKRKFTSESVEALITQVKQGIKDPELAWMFENCYPNTLDTTVDFSVNNGQPDTFIITGDIDAMWLRDSSAQVQGYLPLCSQDPHLAQMIVGLIHRQDKYILLDPYANAFFKDDSKISKWVSDHTVMKPGVYQRKWELDSLCYCIRLDYEYWHITGDASSFDATWKSAMQLVVKTMQDQQRKTGNGPYSYIAGSYRPDIAETSINGGFGRPIKPTGMICSSFRPSDDPTKYLFNIPDNLFAVVSLRQLAEMLEAMKDTSGLAATCRALADEVEQGVLKYGIIDDPKYGKMYVFECDGLGNHLIMDDAGIPSITTIPYLGYKSIQDPISQNSRRYAQSSDNPFFFIGTAAEGTGSPHTSGPKVWPMGIIGRGLTSDNDEEIRHCLEWLIKTHAGTGFIHESFNKNNPTKFTRHWFAWVNNLFGDFVIQLYHEKPQLLQDSSDQNAAPSK